MNNANKSTKIQDYLEDIAAGIVSTISKPQGLEAILLQGSVAKNIADEYSDIELMCIWTAETTSMKRTQLFSSLYKQELFREEQEDGEWYSSFMYKKFKVDICHVDGPLLQLTIDNVMAARTTSIASQTLLASIQDAKPLYGEEAFMRLTSIFIDYPEALAVKCIYVNASFQDWSMRNALLERNDIVALHHLIDATVIQMLRLLLAVNRVYLRSYNFKWMDDQITRLQHKPTDMEKRLRSVLSDSTERSIGELTSLIRESLDITCQQYPDLDLSGYIKTLSYTRQKIRD